MLDDVGRTYSRPIFPANLDENIIKINVRPTSDGKYADIFYEDGKKAGNLQSTYEKIYNVENFLLTSDQPSKIGLTWKGSKSG